MTDFKHTPWSPGPWKYEVSATKKGNPFASVYDANGEPVEYMTLQPSRVAANARLIAAAPEMAKLLEAHLYGHATELNDRTYALLQLIKGERE